MRILLVSAFYKPSIGGTERVIERLGVNLQQHPDIAAVGLLTTRVDYPARRILTELPAHEKLDGLDVFRSTFRPAKLPVVNHIELAGYFSLEALNVVREFKPDVIHFTEIAWWSVNYTIYRLTPGAAHVQSIFYHPIPRLRRSIPHYAVNRRLGRGMDVVQVLTDLDRQQAHAAHDIPLRRIVVIPPGVDVPAAAPVRAGRATVNILAVGRVQQSKGQASLVKMIHRLLEQEPQANIRLWLAGSETDFSKEVRAYIQENGLQDVVKMFGQCSDAQLEELYQQADIFALPTQYESYGLVFMEALAHGLPVVTYGVGPIPAILTAGAKLVALNDEAAFEDALQQLIKDPVQRQQLGQEGYALVSSLYSWPTMANKYVQVYKRAMQAHAAGRRH